MWCQELFSVKESPRRRNREAGLTLTFATIRQFRSALSQFLLWDSICAHPGASVFDTQHKLLRQPCRVTDGAAATLHAIGLSARIGTKSNPSMPLLDRHVRWIDDDLNRRYLSTNNAEARLELALAGLFNLLLWLGWLRASEITGLRWCDISVGEPADYATFDLPYYVGYIGLRLGPETKSSRTKAVDVILAYRTLSGFCPGKWFHRVRHQKRMDSVWYTNTTLLFSTPQEGQWTSLFFRVQYLYPALTRQQELGDAYLTPFVGPEASNRLPAKFWSLHCYRRGARSHVSRGGIYGAYRFRRATKDQVYEHARWRRKRSSESIDKQYQAWTLRDRVTLTLVCH